MEDVLDLYGEPPDPTRPVICFDESPTQLIGEVRAPIPAEPGRLERFDFEYKRNGTVNLFIFLDVNRPWRKVKVTERRAAADFSQCMRERSDVHFPEAEKIRVVMDNLSTHSPASLYNALPAPEARRILRRLEFHFTPKHASWLNMVEIEIGVLRGQCLDRRISSRDILEAEIAAWERQRNDSAARIKWMFTTEKARHKLSRAYPKPHLPIEDQPKESEPLCRTTSVPILTKVSQRACVLRFWGNDEDIGMHLAVSRGAGDAGRVGFWAEHAAEAGLAGTDRVAVG